MIRTGSDINADVTETADVCVVGTGCGGATLGMRLAEKGMRVVFLERGGYYTREDFDQREVDMLAKIDGGRGLDASDDLSVSLTYGNNVGGASVHYWADSYRTPPDRIKLWRERYGIEGHDEAELTPLFEEIEKDLGVHTAERQEFNKMNLLLERGARILGWHGDLVPQARRGCIGSGYCMQGCAYDAKQSMLVTYVPRALSRGALLYADCEAHALEWNGSKVKALVARVLDRATGRPTGKKVRVEATTFVVAAGGYGTPVFLLRQGLKEKLPALGRYTACNPCPMTHALFDEDIKQWRGIPAAFGIDEWRLPRFDGDRYREGGYLLMANQLQPGTLAAVLPGVGRSHRDLMARLPRLGGVISWIDDLPEGHVSLRDDGTPAYHVPLTGQNGQMIRDAYAKQAKLLFAVGAREVLFADIHDTRIKGDAEIERAVAALEITPASNTLAAPHPAGGARMGKDPKESVVGFDHRVHGTDNLFVADPSVFPTAPSVDPSLTIMAWSAIAARHIAASMR
ncbi:MAG: GMC family oxidoreductase [Minicystis sp.]